MSADPAEAMLSRLRGDLKAAMLGRRADEVRVLRAIMGAIDNAQAIDLVDPPRLAARKAFGDRSVEVPRRDLSQAELEALLAREIAEREAVAQEMQRLDRPAQAARLRAEAQVVRRYVTA